MRVLKKSIFETFENRVLLRWLRCFFVAVPISTASSETASPRRALSFLSLFFFLAIPGVSASFPDVSSDHPNVIAIEYLQENEVIQGYPDGTFGPDRSINRAESLKIILLGSGIQVPETVSESHFPDIAVSDWYAVYVETALGLGIVQGYSDGTFRGADTVNLVEYLKMLLEANGTDIETLYPGDLTEDPFADAPKDEWYSKYMQFAKDKHLVEGDEKNNVYPGQPMNRAGFAEIMYRFMIVEEYSLLYFDPNVLSDDSGSLEQELSYLEELLNSDDEDLVISYEDFWGELGF